MKTKIKIENQTVTIKDQKWSCTCGASREYGKDEYVGFACGHIYLAHIVKNKKSNQKKR